MIFYFESRIWDLRLPRPTDGAKGGQSEIRIFKSQILRVFLNRLEAQSPLSSEGAGTKKDLGVWDPLPQAVPLSVCFGNRPQHVLWALERTFRSFR